MRNSIIADKTFKFAIRIVTTYKVLVQKNEYVMSKQLLKSGTSIGANVREALEAQSKKDFVSKLGVALKEAVETEYWVELLSETGYLETVTAKSILEEVQEVIKILNKIIKTTKENLKIVT